MNRYPPGALVSGRIGSRWFPGAVARGAGVPSGLIRVKWDNADGGVTLVPAIDSYIVPRKSDYASSRLRGTSGVGHASLSDFGADAEIFDEYVPAQPLPRVPSPVAVLAARMVCSTSPPPPVGSTAPEHLGRSRGTSSFTGVTRAPGGGPVRWRAMIYVGSKNRMLGTFTSEEAAARAWDEAVRSNQLRRVLNFPTAAEAAVGGAPAGAAPAPAPQERRDEECGARSPVKAHVKGQSSAFVGVSRGVGKSRYRAECRWLGRSISLGSYLNETDAARAVDAFVIAKGLAKPLNLPEEASASASAVRAQDVRRASQTSKFYGVHWARGSRRFKAEVRADGKRVSLGTFDSERDAAHAVDDFIVANSLDRPLNLPGSSSAAATGGLARARKRPPHTVHGDERSDGGGGDDATSRRKRARKGSAARGVGAGANVSALLERDPPPLAVDEGVFRSRFRESCSTLSRADLVAVAVGLKAQTWELQREAAVRTPPQ